MNPSTPMDKAIEILDQLDARIKFPERGSRYEYLKQALAQVRAEALDEAASVASGAAPLAVGPILEPLATYAFSIAKRILALKEK